MALLSVSAHAVGMATTKAGSTQHPVPQKGTHADNHSSHTDDHSTGRVTKEDATHRKLFGDAIRRTRLARGLSQEELAHKSGMDRSYMGRIERGEQALSIDKIWHVADALDTDPSRLFAISLEIDAMEREREQDEREGFHGIDLGTDV